ncbi:MAG: glycerol-3-phosphate dehydrogenase/oxidase [Candidatus Omnitrophica bacterium]|nr:glycerol-3-phosphate dehydrogenase/oxidase [Candidatus Omnitrophota bacterium]
MNRRVELLARLRGGRFDLVVVGGGIVGAGIARDAAMRGLSVALVEQGDFAGGTSSKTSKLIHGGLRYLEQGRLRLVFESLRERRILRTIAPEFVWPLSLMIPVYRGNQRAKWKVQVGLALYGLLARDAGLARPRIYSRRTAIAHEPALNPEALVGAGAYADCQMDDARLCLANIMQAIGFGAVCLNYVALRGFLKTGGRLCGALVEDLRGEHTVEIRARSVINATGPWSDTVRRLSDAQASTRLAPTKGIHVVVPRLAKDALFFEARHDRRMIFVLPWGEAAIVGTTESPVAEPLERLRADSAEVDYLLTESNRLVPGAKLAAGDVLATYAGARPLLAFTGSPTGASREHRIEVDRCGLVSVMGGKYTTFRVMAKQAVDLVCAHLGLGKGRCLTHDVSLLEPANPVALGRWEAVSRRVAPELLARLLIRHGVGTGRILELIEGEPGLARVICPHHDAIQAELVYAAQTEMACTISDILMRRTRIAFSACQGLDALSTLIELLSKYAQLTRGELEAQLHEYRQELHEGLAFRLTSAPAGASQLGQSIVAAAISGGYGKGSAASSDRPQASS